MIINVSKKWFGLVLIHEQSVWFGFKFSVNGLVWFGFKAKKPNKAHCYPCAPLLEFGHKPGLPKRLRASVHVKVSGNRPDSLYTLANSLSITNSLVQDPSDPFPIQHVLAEYCDTEK